MKPLAKAQEITFRIEGMDSITGTRIGRVIEFINESQFIVEARLPALVPAERYFARWRLCP